MNKEASISADWTGGLAYRDATVMEALLKARGPRHSPALPIAIAPALGQKIISHQYYAFQNNVETNPVRFSP